MLLLEKYKRNDTDVLAFILDFEFLSEIRGWIWESYFNGKKNNSFDEYENILKKIEEMMKDVAHKFNLLYVTD